MMPTDAASLRVNPKKGSHIGDKDAKLGACPDNQNFRVGDEGSEIRHGPSPRKITQGMISHSTPYL